MNTAGLFTFNYGKFEARAKMPISKGMWPAFWGLGDNIATAPWPQNGEIDNMETVGTDISTNHGTLHGPGYSGANGLSGSYTLPRGARFSDAYHLFTVEWHPKEVDWFLGR